MKGHIRKRSEGSWTLWFDLGRDETGKRRQKTVTVHGTKRDAERELTRLVHELNTGAFVEPSTMTVAQFLERWLADAARASVSAKTYERYEEVVQKHLTPALGAHRLSKLQPLHIQKYYSTALREGRRDGGGGLSAQTVVHHHRILRAALAQAVKWGLVGRNMADSVEPPKPQRKEMQALGTTHLAHLISAVEETSLHMPVLIAALTGMRRGEVLALRWSDVDLKAGIASVRQSLQQTVGGRAGLTFKQPKTAKSRRVVDLPPMLVEALLEHKMRQDAQRAALGAAWQDHDLICCWEDGRPMVPNQVTQTFADVGTRHGLGIRFHDLRHTHASLLLQQNVHPKVVSERLGHSNIGITLDLYSHVVPGMGRDAALKLDQALRTTMDDVA